MKAAVYRGIDDVRVEEVATPAIGSKEVLVKVEACGVCGTDLKKIRLGLQTPPKIYGHETTGVIAQIGSEVVNWKLGDRVEVNHHVPCRQSDCYYCRRKIFAQCPLYKKTGVTAGFEPSGGGFAEYVRVMDWCVEGMARIPDGISFEEASFIEPLNTCLKGVRSAGIQADDTVFILGQGPIGMLFTRLAHLAGAKTVVTDRFESRRKTALSIGADAALDPEADIRKSILEFSEGRGADVAIVAVPNVKVIAEAFAQIRPAGKVLLFAQTRLQDLVEVDAGQICMNEKSLIGSYSSDFTLQDEVCELIFSRKVDVRPLITHRFPLEDIQEAISIASHPQEGSLKAMVFPGGMSLQAS